MIPLLLAPKDKELTIKKVTGGDRHIRFIEKLGIVEGAKVKLISVNGGDCVLTVKDVRLGITRDLAANIMVY